MTTVTPDRKPGLRLFRHANPAAALGMAVSHLMTKPAFARLGLGTWSRVLVGQINRNHYMLAVDATGRTVGFMGWAATDEACAEAWLAGRNDLAGVTTGDCVIINAWSAEAPAVNRLLQQGARRAIGTCSLLYFKRHYASGRTRNVRLSLPAFTPGGRQPAAAMTCATGADGGT